MLVVCYTDFRIFKHIVTRLKVLDIKANILRLLQTIVSGYLSYGPSNITAAKLMAANRVLSEDAV